MSCSVAKQALPITRFNHPAGDRGADPRRLEFLVALAAVRRVQVGRERIAAEVVRERLAAAAQGGELRPPLGDDLVFVGGGRRGGGDGFGCAHGEVPGSRG